MGRRVQWPEDEGDANGGAGAGRRRSGRIHRLFLRIQEYGFLSLLLAYLSAYWFVTDRVEPAGAVEAIELASAASAGSSP